MKRAIFAVAVGFWLLLSLSVSYSAEKKDLSDEARKCLDCHGDRSIEKKFQNDEAVPTHINPENFKRSAHGGFDCSTCHEDFAGGAHPKRAFKSKRQYKIRSSLVCTKCHGLSSLTSKAVHADLLSDYKKGVSPVCTDCHDSHSTLPAKGGKIISTEKGYCLRCHGSPASMAFRDGENLSLAVNVDALRSSVHHELSCSDCHFGFSSKEHPKRNFRTRRDFSIANSETCRRCHFDKYTKTMESIHYAQLSQGNLKAPVCTDCHGSHSVREGRVEKILSGKRCQQCHKGIYDIYAQSVHGKALIDEHNQDVPICVDCHKAHDIRNPLTAEYRERIPEMCGDCHANKETVGKYGLSTDVVKTYLSDFHGVTLAFYRKQNERLRPGRPIAVCTDCHGTHNISRTIGPEATIIKTNLVKRCQRCHKDADENFPSTWISHYEPNMRKAPLVYIINQIYKIFMPVMLIGLLLQILLHIWRYAINR